MLKLFLFCQKRKKNQNFNIKFLFPNFSLIEKIYTEQNDEPDFLRDYVNTPNKAPSSDESTSSKSSPKPKSTKPAIVVTKTSPLVAAALSCEEEEEEFALTNFDVNLNLNKNSLIDTTEKSHQPSLIDTSTKHQIIKQVSDSMDHLKNELLHKGMHKVADEVDTLSKTLENTRKKQEEMERIKREQEMIRVEKERIEQEKEKLRHEAEQLRMERELILMAAGAPKAQGSSQSQIKSNIQSSSASSTSSTNEQTLENGYGSLNDQPEYELYKSTSQIESLSHVPAQLERKYQINVINAALNGKPVKVQTSPSMQQQWLIEEAERQHLANQQRIQLNCVDQRLRRSVPNLLAENSQNNGNYSSSYINPAVSSTAMTRIYQQQQQQQQKQQLLRPHANKLATQSSARNLNSNFILAAKPPQPNNQHQRMISASQSDLKLSQKAQQQKMHQQQQANKNYQPYSTLQQCPQAPTISLNQKCSSCAQALGQGSAMFIEKLNMAFHLKCFRCSVCNIALGNGKEGTDVRVSGANRLHCNNCFSNDLGNDDFNLVNINIYDFNQNSVVNANKYLNDYNYLNHVYNCVNDDVMGLASKKHLQLKTKIFDDNHFILPNYLLAQTKTSAATSSSSSSTLLSSSSASSLSSFTTRHFKSFHF